MTDNKVVFDNFSYARLSDGQKDDYDKYKEGLYRILLKTGKKKDDIDEDTIVKGWLKQNPSLVYDKDVITEIDIDALNEELNSSQKNPKPLEKPKKDVDPPEDEEKKRQAALEELMRLEEEAVKKRKEDEELAKQKEETLARARASSEEFLKDLAAKLIENPLSKVKLSDMEEYKDGKDVGLKAAAEKLRLAQKKDMAGFTRTLKVKKAGDINCDLIHWDEPDGELILSIVWYVCVNGPVGVGKKTRFGAIPGEYCIKDLFFDTGYPDPVTNSMWFRLCEKLVDYIDIDAPEVKMGKMFRTYGQLWPHCDPVMITKSDYKKQRQGKFMEENPSAFE